LRAGGRWLVPAEQVGKPGGDLRVVVEVQDELLPAADDAREQVIDRRLDLLTAALERIESESRARDASLEKGLRELETGMRELRVAVLQVAAEVHELRVKVEQNSADIRDLSTRMAVLSRLEERVAALEKRTA
jgi:septal ring factor EnvC (AmiA/AmiB activator)